MTTKENSTLEGRALAIIGASEGFNRDTRRAVELSLEDLRETVQRAEAGDTVLDMTDPADAPTDAGRQLHAALSNDGTPDFIMGAVIIAVRVACDRLGEPLPAWLADDQGDDGASLTALFERVPRRGFDFTLEPPRPADDLEAFAVHLSEVLRIARTHPLLAAPLYNGIADAWCAFENGVNSHGSITESETFIRLTLSTAAAQPAEGEGGEAAG